VSDLVVVFADEDARRAVEAMIKRGVGRCLSPFAARYLRHTGRDARVAQQPVEFLRESAALHATSRYLVLWDHHGSGRERQAPRDVEADVCRRLVGAGIAAANVAAIAFVPELEAVYGAAWDRVPFDAALPKESLDAARKRHGIKRIDPWLHEQLGERLPLGKLKSEPGSPLHRISQALQTWFPKATEQ